MVAKSNKIERLEGVGKALIGGLYAPRTPTGTRKIRYSTYKLRAIITQQIMKGWVSRTRLLQLLKSSQQRHAEMPAPWKQWRDRFYRSTQSSPCHISTSGDKKIDRWTPAELPPVSLERSGTKRSKAPLRWPPSWCCFNAILQNAPSHPTEGPDRTACRPPKVNDGGGLPSVDHQHQQARPCCP